jgi:hypothetical protein
MSADNPVGLDTIRKAEHGKRTLHPVTVVVQVRAAHSGCLHFDDSFPRTGNGIVDVTDIDLAIALENHAARWIVANSSQTPVRMVQAPAGRFSGS